MQPGAIESQQSDNDLLTENQARDQELPMSLAWFRRRRVRGGGPPFIRVSNRVFYRRGALREWLAEQAARAVTRAFPALPNGAPD
jgi:hypothetical protein